MYLFRLGNLSAVSLLVRDGKAYAAQTGLVGLVAEKGEALRTPSTYATDT